ncbi:MAG: cobalamin-dependent protein [bacterium]|nr:cobalamin-dependent protein [bacterium]
MQTPIIGSDAFELSPPLGLLRLAHYCRAWDVAVLDLNLLWQTSGSGWRQRWPTSAVEQILESDPSVVGFTSMAVDSHVALVLAREVKALAPHVTVVVGGPHFGQIGEEVLTRFDWVDLVVQGEGEAVLAGLLEQPDRIDVANVRALPIAGRVLRGRPLTGEEFGVLDSSAGIDPAAYWAVNSSRLINLEFGRGCRYACAYCYSPAHFGNGFRLRDAEEIATEFASAAEVGWREAFVVDDNLGNDVDWLVGVCQAIKRVDADLLWRCYLTVRDVHPHVMKELRAAGCRMVYLGVDAVEQRQRRDFSKSFFSTWGDARKKIECVRDAGVVPECAFLIRAVDGDAIATEANLVAALDVCGRGLGLSRLNALSTYNGARLDVTRALEPTTAKVELLQDTAPPNLENPFAEEAPELFPLHSCDADRDRGVDLIHFVAAASFLYRWYRLTLLGLLAERETETPLTRLLADEVGCRAGPEGCAARLSNCVARASNLGPQILFRIEDGVRVLAGFDFRGVVQLGAKNRGRRVRQLPMVEIAGLTEAFVKSHVELRGLLVTGVSGPCRWFVTIFSDCVYGDSGVERVALLRLPKAVALTTLGGLHETTVVGFADGSNLSADLLGSLDEHNILSIQRGPVP